MLIYTLVGYTSAITCLVFAIISRRIDARLKNEHRIASVAFGLIAVLYASILL